MSFSANAPVSVEALRDMLASLQSWTDFVGAGNEVTRIHYPFEPGEGADLPLACIQQTDDGVGTPIGSGIPGLPEGNLEIFIQGGDGDDVDIMEQLAFNIAKELTTLETGLFIQRADYERAGESEWGRESDSASVIVSVDYGLS